MSKVDRLVEVTRSRIRLGAYGRAGDRFVPLREFAQQLGVSLATAQRVHGQLKAQGLLTADSTNPAIISTSAVAPQSAGPRRIGLVVTHIASPFFSNLAQRIQRAARLKNCQTLVAASEYEFEREREIIENFLDIGVEGLLICPGLDDRCPAYYRQLVERGVRLVFVSRRLDSVPCDFVAVRNFAGGASVAEHFLDLGYESFGYLAFPPRLREDERLAGYRATLEARGHTLPASHIADGGGGDIHNGRDAMAKLMSLPKPPRAVFAFNDLLAVGALSYCQEQRIAIPETVAVAGFDNLAESRVTTPPLTTVEYPIQSMANLAVQCVLTQETKDHGGAFNRVLLEPRLIVRRSTDPDWAGESTPQTTKASVDAYQVL